MKRNERRTVGLDRPIHVEWLDAVAGQLASGASVADARSHARNLLEGVVAGKTPQSARGKTITVLGRVWLTPPAPATAMRKRALELIQTASAEERLAIHWAMLSAAYPFFVDVAGSVGKILSLNGEIAVTQLMRRVVEVWGDRSTLRPAVQRLLRSMVQWGALRDGGKLGLYLPPAKRIFVSAPAGELLIEGLLIASERGMPLHQLVGHPAVFPFEVRMDASALRKSERLQVHRQGDQSDFVERIDLASPKDQNALPIVHRKQRRGRTESSALSPEAGSVTTANQLQFF